MDAATKAKRSLRRADVLKTPATWLIIMALLSASLLAQACGRKQGGEEAAAARRARAESARVVARVRVARGGAIYLNGREVSTEELQRALSELKGEESVVWYYREGLNSPQTERELEAMRVIVGSDLPVKPCETEAEFNAPQ